MSNESKIMIKEKIISQIQSGDVKMKPKYYFVLGSLALACGIIGLTILSVFLVSVVAFSLRTHGPMVVFRFEQLLATFPFGVVVVAIVCVGFGAWLLKKYDFSYKKNFQLLIVGFIVSVLFAGWLINYTGLDSVWTRMGPMKEFYKRYDGGAMNGPHSRIMQVRNYRRN
ncbi:MAG: hypothetical protein COV32_02480 [Candidatus Yonathbacteria bacterium CG10_big_fil_rev_8_21_14_0_10_43_136]|uniref:Uncharacterized protein n=2 Tax=Parcubacteria group TaxID=1794811 RepID=A0A2M7Q5D1_9BACT|nr:MAG: hypothetical protein AUK15_00250 [Candidatus Nomurabacteria bacterium CG2_30_43_9]PIQ36161.1 MAG: hypothetical protein COW60_00015 [Candidatus Yonathbacteria bacterium CG17_big_fil_post_rev_8_21_14_2_50_43_9]PIR40611.1 MAG: hypothetical protein COV32_02480 [Candidatus Yonathbacteria bacterium CG10_big_fil_rev_8_21_14_0_10_43_136]PIX56834.1 MAG: hypothetical protein COZ48_03690 [Candidatus Yonathbacteria bacterium CG_4_10_14_3_um_filter_43_12]PIY58292.1 MAG: hypothetical protein COY98_02